MKAMELSLPEGVVKGVAVVNARVYKWQFGMRFCSLKSANAMEIRDVVVIVRNLFCGGKRGDEKK